jgi:cell division protein FtsB
MSDQTLYALITGVVSFALAWFSFKKSGSDNTTKFQDSLLLRIESLESDNETLRSKNEQLLNDNLAEKQKQMELEQKIIQLESDKLRMLDRIQDLERIVAEMNGKINNMEKTNGS